MGHEDALAREGHLVRNLTSAVEITELSVDRLDAEHPAEAIDSQTHWESRARPYDIQPRLLFPADATAPAAPRRQLLKLSASCLQHRQNSPVTPWSRPRMP